MTTSKRRIEWVWPGFSALERARLGIVFLRVASGLVTGFAGGLLLRDPMVSGSVAEAASVFGLPVSIPAWMLVATGILLVTGTWIRTLALALALATASAAYLYWDTTAGFLQWVGATALIAVALSLYLAEAGRVYGVDGVIACWRDEDRRKRKPGRNRLDAHISSLRVQLGQALKAEQDQRRQVEKAKARPKPKINSKPQLVKIMPHRPFGPKKPNA